MWSCLPDGLLAATHLFTDSQAKFGGVPGSDQHGSMAGEARIPSAASLAQEFDLAPVTVRKAIVQLQGEGLLVSQVGWGTYVAAKHSDS
jgi:hypothetical protein